mgnify:CR=1 FL=1|tara:strand:- start:382 stop:903 length:522 start_codon:yes stop_codon:yes gene_type:complete
MPVILGIDPAYRTLGLALVDTDAGEVLASKTINCGTNPYAFTKVLARELEVFDAFAPDIQKVVCEALPMGGRKKRMWVGPRPPASHRIWLAMGAVFYWASSRGLSIAPPVSVMTIKAFAASVTGKRYKAGGTRTQRKALVREAVGLLLGAEPKDSVTDHEDDAILAAYVAASR